MNQSKQALNESNLNGLQGCCISSKAPLRKIKTAYLSSPPQTVFEKVSDHSKVHQWVPMIKCSLLNQFHSVGGNGDGDGSVQICHIGSNYFTEKIVHWNPPHCYAYSIINGKLPLIDHLGVFTVDYDRHDHLGGSIVTWRQYFNVEDFSKSLIVFVMMEIMMKTAFNNLISEFGGENIQGKKHSAVIRERR